MATIPSGACSLVTPLQAALALAARHGLRADRARVLSDGANLVVHLAPAPVVARVATLTARVRRSVHAVFAREIAISAFLDAQGAPVAPPSGEAPPGPHVEAGYVVSLWRHVAADASGPELAAGDFGAMLRDLHLVLRKYAGPMEPFGLAGPPLADIVAYLDQLESGHRRAGPLDGADITRIRAELARPILDGHADVQPIHGDPHPGNLIAGAGGWLWSDFEDACRGPVGWDLACVARTRRFDPAHALAAYGPAPKISDFQRLRELHGLVWWLMYAERDGKEGTRAREIAAERLRIWRAGA